MISKGLRGTWLSGLMRYLFGPGRHEEHVNQRIVAGSDPTWIGTSTPEPALLLQLINDLDDPMVRFGDRTKQGYVYHVVVSIPAVDGVLTDQQWQRCADTFAERLGLDDGVQWVAVHHGTSANGNDHIHLVANLIRDDGRHVNLWQEGMKRRGACLELEDKYQLTGTAPAGLGEGSLSRREVEQVRGGQVAAVADLTRHRVATVVRGVAAGARSEPEFVERLRGEGLIVRARLDKTNPGHVVGYSIAARGGDADGKLVWYGGGTLGKDLRLPALRIKWHQTPDQLTASASVWTTQSHRAPRAEAENLHGAAAALRTATSLLEHVPAGDRFTWYRAASDSAGVLAAAAAAAADDQLRRELITAWKAIHRAIPAAAEAPVAAPSTAPSQAASSDETAVTTLSQTSHQPTAAAWPVPARALPAVGSTSSDVSGWMGGASRVLMASRLADAPHHAQVEALLIQAVQLAAQISRTIAARADATELQRRAATATARAAELANARTRPAGWQFTKSGAEVIDAARAARAAGEDGTLDAGPTVIPGRDVGTEPDR